jgi:hypothetical protein
LYPVLLVKSLYSMQLVNTLGFKGNYDNMLQKQNKLKTSGKEVIESFASVSR